MLCARCGTHEGIKEYDDMLLCEHCFNIKTTADNIVNTNDRLRIEKLIEDIYNKGFIKGIYDKCFIEDIYDKGFNDGYWQSMKDDYSI